MSNTPKPTLHDAEDLGYIRDATIEEHELSKDSEDSGVFELDGRRVIVLLDIDPIGLIGENVHPSTGANGWTKDQVEFGAQTHDDARSLGYTAVYEKDGRRVELIYYVAGQVGEFDVEYQCTTGTIGPEGETMDDADIEYEAVDCPVYEFYEHALRVARNCALADERFKLGQ